MKSFKFTFIAFSLLVLASCSNYAPPKSPKGSFGYDFDYLSKKDSNIVVLVNASRNGEVIVSPKFQGKVFTSTTQGDTGKSMGWVNYKEFDLKTPDPHMNAYGGEDRLWVGPEGGKFAMFFKPGTTQVFDNWHTPPAVDNETWQVDTSSNKMVSLTKITTMENYAGTKFEIQLDRTVQILENNIIDTLLKMTPGPNVHAVAFTTINSITNNGDNVWDKTTGAPCLWNLDMFTPSPSTIIVIPYVQDATGPVATTNYFGQIPPDRVKFVNGTLYFKADGKSRGKLGLPPNHVKAFAGSYDAANNVLTLISYDFDVKATYLNQEWKTDNDPFVGDAVNAYNDGPLANGTQMGPFYEMESVSPAAFLKPGEKLTHKHTVFHFTGKKGELNDIALKTLGVSLQMIRSSFN